MLGFYKTIDNAVVQTDSITDGCWVNAVSPTLDEMEYLIEQLSLERDFVSAALDEEESSRIEVEEEQTLIIVDAPLATAEGKHLVYTTMPVGIIITPRNVVTVCLNETSAVTDIAKGFVKNVQTHMKTRFLLTILLRVAQSFLIRLKHINKMSSHMEMELQKTMKNKDLVQLMGLQKSLTYFSTSLKANEITLEKILRGRVIRLYEEDQDLLEDVIIEFKQAVDMSNIYSTILSHTMDATASIINNSLNDVMKILTIMTTLLAIPSMIFSFYGMNMLDLDGYAPYTWFALLLSLVLVGAAGLFFWKKKF